MVPFGDVYPALAVLGGLVPLLFVRPALRNRETPGTTGLLVLVLSAVVYAVGVAARSVVRPGPALFVAMNVVRLGATLGAAGWFLFFAEYTGLVGSPRRALFGVAGLALAVQVVAWTNPLHGLFYVPVADLSTDVLANRRWLFYVYALVVSGLALVGLASMVADVLRSRGIRRRQGLYVLAGFVPPATTLGVSTAGLTPVDVTPLGFVLGTAVLSWATFSADLFEVVSVGRARAVERIEDPVVTLDGADRVVDSNPAARDLFDAPSDWKGTPAASFFAPHADRVRAVRDPDTDRTELSVPAGPGPGGDGGADARVDGGTDAFDGGTGAGDDGADAFDGGTGAGDDGADAPDDGTGAHDGGTDAPAAGTDAGPDGRDRHFDVETTPLRGPQDRPRGRLLVFRDVTELKRRERALRSLTERYELALDGTDTGVWEYDARTGEVDFDGRMKRLLGVDPARPVDGYEGILDRVHPEDVPELRAAHEEGIDDGAYEIEFRVDPDGRDGTGDPDGRDGTGDPDWDGRVDGDGSRPAVDPAGANDGGDGDAVGDPGAAADPAGAGGGWRWLRVRGEVQYEDGDPVRVVGIGQDVTERTERERELERKNRSLDEFASVVSHDVATPLGVIENRAHLIEMTGDTDHAADIYEATERVRSLVEELRTLARRGDRVGETAPVDVGVVAREAWESVASTGTGATLVVEDSRTVEADPGRLRQLFENLLENAVEHGSTRGRTDPEDAVDHGAGGSPPDAGVGADGDGRAGQTDGGGAGAGGNVTVRVGTHGTGFYVADDGAGFGDVDPGRLFEWGYSAGRDGDGSGEGGDGTGTGLGLAIVARIAEGHGWSVRAGESADGGARFEVVTDDRPGGDA